MNQTPSYTPKEVTKKLEKLGMVLVRTHGSHNIYRGSGNRYAVVPMHSGDIKRGTLKSILAGAKITVLEFIGM